MIWLVGMYGFIILGAMALLVRNKRVYAERMRVIDEIHRLNVADFKAGRYDEYLNRYAEFDRISYNSMVLSLRPVRSFFADSPALSERDAA